MGKKVLFFVFAALLVAACNNTSKDQEQAVMTVSQLLENAVDLVDQEVLVEGNVIHVCAHGGARLFIEDANGQRIKVEAGSEVVQFDATLENSEIVVTGFLRELRIDEAYLQEWEAELATEAAEVVEETMEVAEEGLEVVEEVIEEGEEMMAEAEEHIHMEDHPDMPGKDHHVDDPYAKIAAYREKIAATETGYVSEYWFEATTFEIKVIEGEEVVEEEIVEEEVIEESPVAEQE